MGKSCSGILIVKNILAPEIETPSLMGFVRTLSTMPKTKGIIIIAM
jgi:hypothetical protein